MIMAGPLDQVAQAEASSTLVEGDHSFPPLGVLLKMVDDPLMVVGACLAVGGKLEVGDLKRRDNYGKLIRLLEHVHVHVHVCSIQMKEVNLHSTSSHCVQ